MKTRRQAATVINLAELSHRMREKRGTLSHRKAAKEVGVSTMTYYRIEQNFRLPDIDNYVKICRWLGAKLGDFVFWRLL